MSIIDSSIHNELENSVVKKSNLFYVCLKFINICRCLGFADKASIMGQRADAIHVFNLGTVWP